jgi:hypothetical protein
VNPPVEDRRLHVSFNRLKLDGSSITRPSTEERGIYIIISTPSVSKTSPSPTMRFSSVFTAVSLLGLSSAAVLPRQDEAYAGYLLSTFTDANPSVFWYLADASDPLAFTPLNGGDPVLASTLGTKGVRDIFLTSNEDRSEYTIIATGA